MYDDDEYDDDERWRRRRRTTTTTSTTNEKQRKKQSVSQTIDQVMTIKTHTESSKSELSSRGKGPFKVFRFFFFFLTTESPQVVLVQVCPLRTRAILAAIHLSSDICDNTVCGQKNWKTEKLWTDVYPSRITPILMILYAFWSSWPELSF